MKREFIKSKLMVLSIKSYEISGSEQRIYGDRNTEW